MARLVAGPPPLGWGRGLAWQTHVQEGMVRVSRSSAGSVDAGCCSPHPWSCSVLLTLVLVWESIRGNIAPDARDDWPWRLQLLDMEALGSLMAVAVGAVLARAQYARTVRPCLGWRGSWTKGHLRGDSQAWTVGVLNGEPAHRDRRVLRLPGGPGGRGRCHDFSVDRHLREVRRRGRRAPCAPAGDRCRG